MMHQAWAYEQHNGSVNSIMDLTTGLENFEFEYDKRRGKIIYHSWLKSHPRCRMESISAMQLSVVDDLVSVATEIT